MFQNAVQRASKYTFPYAGLRRKNSGEVFSTIGAFVGLNDQGYCVTAKHILSEIKNAQKSIDSSRGIDKQIGLLHSQNGGDKKARKHQIRNLEKQKLQTLSNRAEIWACGQNWQQTQPKIMDVVEHSTADIAVFRLEPFTPFSDQEFPVLRSDEFEPGTSIARIGFPWHSVETEYANNSFDIKSGFPAPFFALEGIISRFAIYSQPENSECVYIQTSTPGLKGQSGGPLFDLESRLCGIQSSTVHLDLGFDARYVRDKKETVERQFLNVGQAVHIKELIGFLDQEGISYSTLNKGKLAA